METEESERLWQTIIIYKDSPTKVRYKLKLTSIHFYIQQNKEYWNPDAFYVHSTIFAVLLMGYDQAA